MFVRHTPQGFLSLYAQVAKLVQHATSIRPGASAETTASFKRKASAEDAANFRRRMSTLLIDELDGGPANEDEQILQQAEEEVEASPLTFPVNIPGSVDFDDSGRGRGLARGPTVTARGPTMNYILNA